MIKKLLFNSYFLLQAKVFKRYQCQTANSEEDRLQCLAIRHAIFSHELHSNCQPLEDELDSLSTLIAIRDKKLNEIIGCCRITAADQIAKFPSHYQYYRLNRFPDQLLEKIAVISNYAIQPRYRHRFVNFIALFGIYKYVISQNFTACTIISESYLHHMYTRLGFQ